MFLRPGIRTALQTVADNAERGFSTRYCYEPVLGLEITKQAARSLHQRRLIEYVPDLPDRVRLAEAGYVEYARRSAAARR